MILSYLHLILVTIWSSRLIYIKQMILILSVPVRDLYNMLLEISPDLKLAYELKELYRGFNKRCSFEQAGAQLDYLIELFEHSDLDCYKEFISLLKHWKPEIINSFRRPYDDRRQFNALTNEQLINVIPSITCIQKDDYIRMPILALYSHPISLFKTHYLFYLNKVMHIMSHLFRLLFSQTLYYVIFL